MPLVIPNNADATYERQSGVYAADIFALQAQAAYGVVSGLAASVVSGLTTRIAAGQARVGEYFPFAAQTDVTHGAADATNPRIDLVTIDHNGTVAITAGSAAAAPVAPAMPANAALLCMVYIPAGTTTLTSAMLTDKRVAVEDAFDDDDEFVSGALVTTGNISDLSWGLTAATGGTAGFQNGAANHPGVLRLATGATSGNNQRIHLGASATAATLTPSDFSRIRGIVAIPTITTGVWKFGLGVDVSVATADQFGTAGAWFEFDPAANANWQTNTRQASTTTSNNSSVAVTAGNWYQLEMVRLQNGSWQFAINGALAFTHSANQPTTGCMLGFLVQTATAAARNFDIDYCAIKYNRGGQRWT
jgi:hypothetical protein